MRTRHSPTAAVIALTAILVGVIISLLASNGPTAHTQVPGVVPASAGPSSARPRT